MIQAMPAMIATAIASLSVGFMDEAAFEMLRRTDVSAALDD